MTRIHHFDDGVTPPLDIDAIDRRRAERSATETAARQTRRDSARLGRDAVHLGELQLAAGNLERARDAFAIATRHQAPDAADLLHTVTELLDVLDSPVISNAAADTAMARMPVDPDNEPEIVTLRAQELVRRLDELQARIERLTADANNARTAINDARTRITSILEDAQARAAAILDAAQLADSTAQDAVAESDGAVGASGHVGQKRLIMPADFDAAGKITKLKNVWVIRDDDTVTARSDLFVNYAATTELFTDYAANPTELVTTYGADPTELFANFAANTKIIVVVSKSYADRMEREGAPDMEHWLPRADELPAHPLALNRVKFVVGTGGVGASSLRRTRFNDLLSRVDLSRDLPDRWHAAQLDKLKLAFEALELGEVSEAEWAGIRAAEAKNTVALHRNELKETYFKLQELLRVIADREGR